MSFDDDLLDDRSLHARVTHLEGMTRGLDDIPSIKFDDINSAIKGMVGRLSALERTQSKKNESPGATQSFLTAQTQNIPSIYRFAIMGETVSAFRPVYRDPDNGKFYNFKSGTHSLLLYEGVLTQRYAAGQKGVAMLIGTLDVGANIFIPQKQVYVNNTGALSNVVSAAGCVGQATNPRRVQLAGITGNNILGAGTITATTGTFDNLTFSSASVGDLTATTLSLGFTAGSVVFSNGSKLTEDNANLFWDNTNNRLGVGTSNPGYNFECHGTFLYANGTAEGLPALPVGGMVIQNNNAAAWGAAQTIVGGTAGFSAIYFADADDQNPGAVWYRHSDNLMVLYTNTTAKIKINDAGVQLVDVGIGAAPIADTNLYIEDTTAIAYLKGTTSNAAMIIDRKVVGADAELAFWTNGVLQWKFGMDSGPALFQPDFQIKTVNNANPDFVIDYTTKNVGIGMGADSPVSRLHVNTASVVTEDIFILENDINNNGEYIGQLFKVVGGLDYGAIRTYIGVIAGDSQMSFLTTTDGGTNLVRHMTIDHNGNVGIGTVTPNRSFHVNGIALVGSASGITNTAAGDIEFRSGSPSQFWTDSSEAAGSRTFRLQLNGGDLSYKSQNDAGTTNVKNDIFKMNHTTGLATIGHGLTLADGAGLSLEEAITYTGGTGVNHLFFPDGLANAFDIGKNGDPSIVFGSETDEFVTINKQLNATNLVVFNDVIKILQRAAAIADTADYGQLWVKSDTPNVLMFTDDTGADFTVDVTAV